MNTPEEHKWLLKHSGSSLFDTCVTVHIHEKTKTVELISEQFDSIHISGLVLDVLPRYEIYAWLDESNYKDVRNPEWDLIYVLCGVRYRCLVAVIPDYSIKDGIQRNDPRRVVGKQTTLTLTRFVETAETH